jgi:hypothetical protein
MSEALTGPFAVAAIVVCVAALAKLRQPEPAAQALGALHMPSSVWAVRALAAGELIVGVVSLVSRGVVTGVALAALYSVFCGTSLALARRRTACGCFGEDDVPASRVQAVLSAALALAAAAAAIWPPHDVFSRPAVQAVVLTIGIVGAAYATVVVYRELPRAWHAWSGA